MFDVLDDVSIGDIGAEVAQIHVDLATHLDDRVDAWRALWKSTMARTSMASVVRVRCASCSWGSNRICEQTVSCPA